MFNFLLILINNFIMMKSISTLIIFSLLLFNIKAQDSLRPPLNLQAQVFNNTVTLNWISPAVNTDYLSWENGQIGNSIGLGSAGTFAVAAKWDPDQIPGFVGENIEKVSIHTAGTNTSYTLKIWQGELPETPLLSQPIEDILINQWFDVSLDSIITISPDESLWVGYEVQLSDADYPASIDTGPGIEGYGDWIFYEGEWSHLSYFGFSNNWSIRVFTSGSGEQLPNISKQVQNPQQAIASSSLPESPFILNPITPQFPESIGSLTGYNVYNNGEQLNSEPVTITSYYAGAFDPGNYLFGVTAVYDDGESAPAEINVEVGGNEISFDPEFIFATIAEGETLEVPVSLTNTGINNVDWVITEIQPWITSSSSQGFLETGDSEEIVFLIDASDLQPAYYYGIVIFSFNDVLTPASYYQIQLYVQGEPSIAISPETIDFGNVEIDAGKNLQFQILNDGQSVVSIDSLVSTSPYYNLANQSVELFPYQHLNCVVNFSPDSLGFFEGQILVYSSISAEPSVLSVSGSGVLASPSYVNASVLNENDVELTWLPPAGGSSGNTTILGWGSGENANAIGYGTEATFSYGAKWTPEYLGNANGQTAISVSFFPYGEFSQFTLKIYSGTNAANLITSQSIGSYTPYEWNVVNINTPFEIDGSDELWVTFEVFNADGEFPAGTDTGPAFTGFGDLISIDNLFWESMSDSYGLDFNWNIQLFATDQIASSKPNQVPRNNLPNENTATLLQHPNYQQTENSLFPSSIQNTLSFDYELLGYNIYKNNSKINDELLAGLTFTDTGLEPGIYDYGVTAVYDAGESPGLNDVVQIGGPELVISPTSLTVELESGEIVSDTILIANLGNIDLEWEANATSNLAYPLQTSGIIAPGGSQEIEIVFDATFVGGGTLNLGIYFNTNNFNNPQTYFPVTMIVEGAPYIFINSQELIFGNVSPGESKTRYIEVFNFGYGEGLVFDLISDNDAFSVADSSYIIPYYESIQIPVEFTPESVESYSGILTFSTNDPFNPEFTIALSGNGYLMRPLNLNASVVGNNVNLSWIPPDGGDGDYLQYDDGFNYQSIGLASEGTYVVAAKWEPEQLQASIGKMVTALGFFPASETSSFTIKIWKGENADTLLVSDIVTNYNPYEWNDIFVTTPVEILEDETYYFGYEVTQPYYDFPAGVDAGPAMAGFGDLISIDGSNWEQLSEYGLDYNWNLRAFVSEPNLNMLPAKPILNQKFQYNNSGSFVQLNKNINKHNSFKNTEETAFFGYNIYRDGIKINSEPTQETGYFDENLEFGTTYLYAVTAVYDAGESNPAGPIEVIVSDSVQMPLGWQPNPTNTTHIIYVPTTQVQPLTSIMDNGDWLGVFYLDNGSALCAGAAEWHNNDTIKIVAFGDDPQTTEKEGFEIGEYLTWKAFLEESGEEHTIEVTYHSGMPNNDGLFDEFGLSMLTSINLLPTAINNNGSSPNLTIFPNPGNGMINFSSSDDIESVTIYNYTGQIAFNFNKVSEQSISLNLAHLNSGTYFAVIKTSSGNQFTEKLIIN